MQVSILSRHQERREVSEKMGGLSVLSKIPETAHLWYTNKREALKHLPVFYVLTILKSVIICRNATLQS